jgi:hypothetical protein
MSGVCLARAVRKEARGLDLKPGGCPGRARAVPRFPSSEQRLGRVFDDRGWTVGSDRAMGVTLAVGNDDGSPGCPLEVAQAASRDGREPEGGPENRERDRTGLGVPPCRCRRQDAIPSALREFLDSGSDDHAQLVRHLAACWSGFRGSSESAMDAHKLSRLEEPHWDPPRFTFTIERHGGTVYGSTRAQLQRWVVDLDARTAEAAEIGHRQLRPMSPRLDVKPIAAEIAELIVAGRHDDRLQWSVDRTKVRVLTGVFIPDVGPKQTGTQSTLREGSDARGGTLWMALRRRWMVREGIEGRRPPAWRPAVSADGWSTFSRLRPCTRADKQVSSPAT